jgi:hypothetical protein
VLARCNEQPPGEREIAEAILNRRASAAHNARVNSEPLDLALRHISETKSLLDALITSSESFDYPKAKIALKELQKKSRELAKVRAALEVNRSAPVPPNVVRLPFRAS